MSEDDLVHNPHDRFFKETFTRLENASDFLRSYLPPRIAAVIDWPSLKLEQGTFIDEHLSVRSSDLLYSAKVRGKTAFLYCLFEHQSSVDPDMAFRLLTYMVRIWEQWRKQASEGLRPPSIIPLVLHQGSEHWTVSPFFRDWVGLPKDLKELAQFVPDFEHVLIDLSRLEMERIEGSLRVRLALTLLKAAREDRLEEWLERFGPSLMEFLHHPDRVGMFRALMMYAFAVDSTGPRGSSTFEQFASKIKESSVREGVMSIAEQLIQRGRQEGRHEGRLEGKIQLCQQLLGLPVMSTEELVSRDAPQLQALLEELQARIQNRLQ